MASNSTTLAYRPDIDGLRAIAVTAVLIFHFFPESLRGGFVGVDVFFVISGFLVTGIVCKGLDARRFSFADFYRKRVRRLFPSLILSISACLLAGWFLMPSDELSLLGKHIFAGSTFFSNILLYSESGYFDGNSDLKPLLHLWSLGVEEQFYLFWPLLLWILSIGKKSRFIIPSLVITCAVSLLLNLFLVRNSPSFTFYMLPTRLWELALGGILTLFPFHQVPIVQKFKNSISFLGLATVTISFFLINGEKLFPGAWALLPVLGTTLVILAGPSAAVNGFLSRPSLVFIGLISYPLYLWHWPLVAFARLHYGEAPQVSIRIALIITAFALAAFSYLKVEKPLRDFKATNSMAFKLCAAVAFLGICGVWIWNQGGFPGRNPAIEAGRKTAAPFRSNRKNPENPVCSEQFRNVEMCAITDPSRSPTILVVGDSHAEHLFPGLSEVLSSRGENVLMLARSGTVPLWKVVSVRRPDSNLDDIFEYAERTPTLHTILLGGFWESYFEKNGARHPGGLYKNHIYDSLATEDKDESAVFKRGLSRTIEKLIPLGKKIAVFLDIPILPFHIEKCLPRPYYSIEENCSFPIEQGITTQGSARTFIQETLKSYPAIKIYDPYPFLCPAGTCSLLQDEQIVYSDNFHLSELGSRWLWQRMPY